MTYWLRRTVEQVLSQWKGRAYALDPAIPLTVLGAILLRRFCWLARGLCWTLVLQGRPRMVFMAPGVELRTARMIRFGRAVTLERGVILDGLSRRGIHLGDNVALGAYTIIRASMLSHLGEGVRFGRNSSCEAYSFIGAAGMITIGENVIMGQHVSFHAENHNFGRTDLPIRSQGVTRKGISVDDDCWIGANAVFLDGCHVGRGSVIAAGAVVRGEVRPHSILAGVPARVLRSRLASEKPPEAIAAAGQVAG